VQYTLQVFETQDHAHFRMLDIDGEPWFVLADACAQLDLKPNNGSYFRHAERLDDDEKQTVSAAVLRTATSPSGGEVKKRVAPTTIIINESGLYSLILRSDRPEAKKFKKWITSEVLPSIRKTGGFQLSKTPAFIKRYNDNWDRVESGYFSVINELTVRLWGRLEKVGHIMADRAPDGKEIRPDSAVGRRFSDWLKLNHPTLCGSISYYQHKTAEWEGEARQYPNSMLHLYIEYVDTVWIPQHSEEYFRTRDPAALPHLPKLLPNAARGQQRLRKAS
jgi:prophage antirepressor-like protein